MLDNNITKCIDLPDYAGNTILKKVNKEGFVECNVEEICEYEDGRNQECSCGYNSKGKAYCPRALARSKII